MASLLPAWLPPLMTYSIQMTKVKTRDLVVKEFKLTLKAGTGRRIVECESLARYWYKGKLLCAALEKEYIWFHLTLGYR